MKIRMLEKRMWLVLAMLLQTGCLSMNLGGSADRLVSYVLVDARPSMSARQEPISTTVIIQSQGGDPMANSLSIAYSLAPNQRELYQLSRWTERPVSALSRLLIQRLHTRGSFQSVAALGEGVGGDLGLNLVIESMYHDATTSPGNVKLSVRADLIQRSTRELLSRQVFNSEADLSVIGPEAVVDAMGIAVADVFDALVPWLETETAAGLSN